MRCCPVPFSVYQGATARDLWCLDCTCVHSVTPGCALALGEIYGVCMVRLISVWFLFLNELKGVLRGIRVRERGYWQCGWDSEDWHAYGTGVGLYRPCVASLHLWNGFALIKCVRCNKRIVALVPRPSDANNTPMSQVPPSASLAQTRYRVVQTRFNKRARPILKLVPKVCRPLMKRKYIRRLGLRWRNGSFNAPLTRVIEVLGRVE